MQELLGVISGGRRKSERSKIKKELKKET